MREKAARHTRNIAQSGLIPDETPLWMRHAYAYKREPSVAEGYDVITGFAEFNGLRGSEASALKEAVDEINPKIRVHDHHQRIYTFVILPTDEATKVEKKLRTWKYSSRNQVDLLHRSLDLPERVVVPRHTGRKTQRTRQSETLFR